MPRTRSMSDNTLANLMGNVPSRSIRFPPPLFASWLTRYLLLGRCILLLEDLDAAFTRGISRDEKSTGAPTRTSSSKDTAKTKEETDDSGSTLSLSGLLNSLSTLR